MIVDNVDALRTWIAAKVNPLCDAEPIALTNYILALLKKDKPMDELRIVMEKQMEVFLLNETVNFMDALFTTLTSKDYLTFEQVNEKGDGGGDATTDDKTNATAAAADEDANLTISDCQSRRRRRRHRRSHRADSTDRSTSLSSCDGDEYADRKQVDKSGEGGIVKQPPPPTVAAQTVNSQYAGTNRSLFREGTQLQPQQQQYGHRPYGQRRPQMYQERSGAANIPMPVPRAKCRDYEEKGFCLMGAQCPFAHGVDAVVLEDQPPPPPVAMVDTSKPPPPLLRSAMRIARSSVPAYNPMPLLNNATTPAYVPSSAPSTDQVPPKFSVPPPQYTPTALHPPAAAAKICRYALKSISTESDQNTSRRPRPNIGGTQLVVRHIPPEVNVIAHINNHFARFGPLANIQIKYQEDPTSALVTFLNETDCHAAYRCTDAVMNNRFIRLFYQNSGGGDAAGQRQGEPGGVSNRIHAVSGRGRGTVRGQVKSTPPSLSATRQPHQFKFNKAAAEGTTGVASRAAPAEAENAKLQRSKDDSASADRPRSMQQNAIRSIDATKSVPLSADASLKLHKSLQKLLDSYIAEQKNILILLEKRRDTLMAEERRVMMDMLRSIGAKVDATKSKLSESLKTLSLTSLADSNRHATVYVDKLRDEPATVEDGGQVGQQRSEISTGVGDMTSPLTKRKRLLSASKAVVTIPANVEGATATSPQVVTAAKRPRRSVTADTLSVEAAAAIGTFTSPTAIDRRCVKLAVTGFDLDERDEIVAHFRQFGEIVSTSIINSVTGAPLGICDEGDSNEEDGNNRSADGNVVTGTMKPILLVQFRDRANADRSKVAGAAFGVEQKSLDIKWHIERVEGRQSESSSVSSSPFTLNKIATSSSDLDDRAKHNGYNLTMDYLPPDLLKDHNVASAVATVARTEAENEGNEAVTATKSAMAIKRRDDGDEVTD